MLTIAVDFECILGTHDVGIHLRSGVINPVPGELPFDRVYLQIKCNAPLLGNQELFGWSDAHDYGWSERL